MEQLKVTKQSNKVIIILLLLTFVHATYSASTKPASILLQEGLYAEEVEGNLDEAITIYQQVITSSEQMEQSAAHAAYRIGLCYLKKGDTEQAAQQFKELISKYPKQESLVKEAQKQLEKLKPPITYTFGPLIEKIIYTDETGIDCVLDIDTSRTLSLPEGLVRSSPPEEGIPWFLENGIDVINCAGRLQVFDMAAIEVNEEIWDSENNLNIENIFKTGTSKELLPTSNTSYTINKPYTYAIKTREDGIGLLQILEKRDTYLKLRYKMLRQEREAFLPDADDVIQQGIVPIILDLSTGKILPGSPNKQYFNQLKEGDIAYFDDEGKDVIGCFRGAKITRKLENGQYSDTPDQNHTDTNMNLYIITIPEEMIITTNEGDTYDLKILSKYSKGLNIKYAQTIMKNLITPNATSIQKESPDLDKSGMALIEEETRNQIEHFEQSFASYFKHETRYELADLQEKNNIIQEWEREALGDDFNRRVAAIAALGNVKAKEALDTLIKIAEEPMGNNRPKWMAVRGLAQIKDMKAIPTLIGLVNHGNANVKVYTRLALANITGVYFKDDENAWKNWWIEQGHPEYKETMSAKIPVVISSKPENYSQNVSPDTTEISVTFDREMMDRSWSWVRWNYPFPESSGNASYDKTKTTCTLSVKMEPGKAYLVRINSDKYTNFKGADGTKAQPFVLVFATKDKNGNPTPIPEEMLDFAKQVNSETIKIYDEKNKPQANGRFGPVDFTGYFEDSSDGAQELEKLWNDRNKDLRDADEIIKIVRKGLRNYHGSGNILRWIGNLFIWGNNPQNKKAIELMNHASGSPVYNLYGDAIYFGLSVTSEKTPEIMAAMAAVAMKTDDYSNVTGRINWGSQNQKDELMACLEPYLTSDDASVRQKAKDVKDYLTDSSAFMKKRAQEREESARKEYGDNLEQYKAQMLTGNSKTRMDTLKQINSNGIMSIIDESFIEAFEACTKDSDSQVRNKAATTMGTKYVWGANPQNTRVIEILTTLLNDSDRSTRYSAVYYGLSTIVPDKELAEKLLATILDDREINYYGRVIWGLRRNKQVCIEVLKDWMNNNEQDKQRALKAYEIYEDVTGEQLPEEFASRFAGQKSDAHEGLVAVCFRPNPISKEDLQKQFVEHLKNANQLNKVLDFYIMESRESSSGIFICANLADRNAIRETFMKDNSFQVIGYMHGAIGPTGSGWIDSLKDLKEQFKPYKIILTATN